MTKEDFITLSPAAQEQFINEGGVISIVAPSEPLSHSLDSASIPTTVISSVVEHIEKEPLEQGYASSASVDSSTYSNGFDIENPVELLFMLDDNIKKGKANGGVDLYPWQIQAMLDFAEGGTSDKNPYQALIRAANGSGKDKYIIAPCVVWLSMRFCKTVNVVTSASGAQLDRQTCRYIKALCDAVNAKFGCEIWNTKYRHYICDFGDGLGDKSPNKSEVFCYATDEAGKAEGYHPTDHGCKMGIFVSEDKTIPDEINVALNKCTGYTHRVHASTPGLPMGHFHDYDSIAIPREVIKSVTELAPTDWVRYLVTAYDCPDNLTLSHIQQLERDLPGGKFGAAFKSQVMAEFGTTDEMVVVPYIYVRNAIEQNIPWIQEPYNTGGLDLSDGGAETVLLIRNGNKHIKTIAFRFDNTEDTLDFLEDQFNKEGLRNREALIFADCCGIGKPMINSLKRRGWSNMRYVDSRHAAREARVYSNLGTELFFNVRKLFENKELIILRDELLIRQLSGRYYKINTKNIHALLTKLEQRSRGFPSPDRADAFNLAFWNYKSTKSYEEKTPEEVFGKEEDKVEKYKVKGDFDLNVWANADTKKYKPEHIDADNLSELKEEIAAYNQKRRLIVN